jgi:hypothetical protein
MLRDPRRHHQCSLFTKGAFGDDGSGFLQHDFGNSSG